MPLCAVPGCNNGGVHLFPKDPVLKIKWERALRRKNFVATVTSRLCRDHFLESDYMGISAYTAQQQLRRHLKKGTIPSIFPWTRRTTTPTSRSLTYEERSRRRLDFTTETYADKIMNVPSTSNINIPEPIQEIETGDAVVASVPHQEHRKNTISVSSQSATVCSILSLELIREKTEIIHFYTGLETYEKFMLIFNLLSPMCYDLTYRGSKIVNVSACDQLLITMMKLRRYLPDIEIAFLFGISSTSVSNIFVTWVNFMYEMWSIIDIWPTKELVQFHMPEPFKKEFLSTRIIVDTTEMPISKPGNPIAQQVTFSSYKHKNTLKAMIGATPGGLISYVSECYGGSVSDRQIIERSGLVDKCESEDSIMADRGFNVQDIFAQKNITVNIPTFLKGRSQIPGIQVIQDRKLASKRVHIERIIGLAKTFKILKAELSPYYVSLGSRILFVCTMLCNFRENIMK